MTARFTKSSASSNEGLAIFEGIAIFRASGKRGGAARGGARRAPGLLLPVLPAAALLALAVSLSPGAVPARAQRPAAPPQSLLVAPRQAPCRWFASTDPRRRNEDYILLKPGETRRVALAAGELARLWSTASQPDKLVLALQSSQNGAPVELLRHNKARRGTTLYQKAFTLYPIGSTPTPARTLKSGASLVAVNRDTQPNKWFYQVSVRPQAARSPEAAIPTISQQGGTKANLTLQPGQEGVLYQASRAGLVHSISLDVQPATPQTLNALRLRATWDKGAKPAVDAPLPALCGQFFDARPTRSDGWNFRRTAGGARLDITWPMPFGAGARIGLFNGGAAPVKARSGVTVESKATNVPPAYRFCAAYGSARTQKGKPVQMLNVRGQGAFVGLALGIKPTPESGRRAFAYLEGNEVITADGMKFEGTGTEDFFNSAWYFPDAPFSQPLHGMTFKQDLPPQVSAYRLMIPDAVPFKRELNFAFGHGSSDNSDDLEYRWAAFWYQKPPLNFEVVDDLKTASLKTASAGATAGRARRANRDPAQRSSALWLAAGFIVIAIVAGIVATSSPRKSKS